LGKGSSLDGIETEAALRALGDPSMLVDRVVGEALARIPSAQGSVLELLEGGVLRWAHASGTLAPHVGLRLQPRGSLSGLSVQLGATLRCDDADGDPRVDRDACRRLSVRSMVTVPLTCQEERVGVLKVSSAKPFAFSDRDVATLAGLASFIGAVLTAVAQVDEVAGEWHSLPVKAVLRDGSFTIVHQAIVGLRTGAVVASEALCRFTSSPSRSPEKWFRDAWRVGLGAELELAAAAAALRDLDRLPRQCRLAINVSPALFERPELVSVLGEVDASRVVLEVGAEVGTEDLSRAWQALAVLRRSGVQVAVNDAGRGSRGLSRIVELSPDIVKLDRALVGGIDSDPVRRSLATAVVALAGEIGAVLVAQGVETEDQLDLVSRLGIEQAQGYLLGRPGPVDQLDRAQSPAPTGPLATPCQPRAPSPKIVWTSTRSCGRSRTGMAAS